MRQTATTVARPYVALERAFAFAALVAACSATTAGCLARMGFGWQAMVLVTLLALLACAAVGVWAQDMMAQCQRGEMARIYAAALQGVRDRGVEDRAREPTRLEAFGLSLAALVDGVRVAVLGQDTLGRWATDMRTAIVARQRACEALAARMGEDAHVLAAAAAGSRQAEVDLRQSLGAVRGHAENAAAATGGLADDVEKLANAVRTVTAQSGRATEIASRMSEAAFTTQRRVAALAEGTTGLIRCVDQVQSVLHRAEMLALNASIEAARVGEDGRGFAVVAAEVKILAQAGTHALETMLESVRGLQNEVSEITVRVQGISEVVQTQHEFGHALSHAAMLQSDAVSLVLQRVSVAHGEMKTLNAEMDNFRMPDTRLGAGLAAEQAVERLPGYAEAMAQILRGLPDFGKATGADTEVR
jgi:methyl-accepting chemotaxis protein